VPDWISLADTRAPEPEHLTPQAAGDRCAGDQQIHRAVPLVFPLPDADPVQIASPGPAPGAAALGYASSRRHRPPVHRGSASHPTRSQYHRTEASFRSKSGRSILGAASSVTGHQEARIM
jgi:hypothetical protein